MGSERVDKLARSVAVDHIGECDADRRWSGVHESYRGGDPIGCGWFIDAMEMAGHAATRAAEEIAQAIEAERTVLYGQQMQDPRQWAGLTRAAAIARLAKQ